MKKKIKNAWPVRYWEWVDNTICSFDGFTGTIFFFLFPIIGLVWTFGYLSKNSLIPITWLWISLIFIAFSEYVYASFVKSYERKSSKSELVFTQIRAFFYTLWFIAKLTTLVWFVALLTLVQWNKIGLQFLAYSGIGVGIVLLIIMYFKLNIMLGEKLQKNKKKDERNNN